MTLSVALSNPSSQTVTVSYAATGGTAFNAVDYGLTAGSLTFAPGQTAKTISFTVTDDSADEDDETVVVSLSSPSNAALGSNSSHTYVIGDNDPLPAVAFEVSSSSGDEFAVPAPTIKVILTGLTNRTVTVFYAATGGTATSGTDYTLSAGTLTFSPGETSKTIPLTIIDDFTYESPFETIVITIASPTNGTLTAPTVHTYTIDDSSDG